MRDVMVDIETLGTRPGSAILSIGATPFDPRGVGRLACDDGNQVEQDFYAVISLVSSVQKGASVDNGTLLWWRDQSDAAQAVLFQSLGQAAMPLPDALDAFAAWLAAQWDPTKLRLWGNGSDFDNVLIAAAYAQIGLPTPWKFYNGRCFRTLKNLFPGHEPPRKGDHHNALDDARHQARHAMAIGRARGAI